MTELSLHVRRLRAIADALEARPAPNDDPYQIHPDTLALIESRTTTRGQLNYAVPVELQLQRRIRRYNADHDIPHGDVAAEALDTWLRAKGYPPDPAKLKEAAE